MPHPAIQADQLTKRYRLGTGVSAEQTLAERISHGFRRAIRRSECTATEQWFDALRGVSFEVRQGEVLGVIGRNGAGKSTLLKLLARITEPTSGSATIHGRVGSLLEVGTGFHPELSGRENIYLNGAILGMKRREIKKQFDAIVEFAEIARFLDTPVKRYSSGMYVRLAFAVAAHLEPEVLLIDEVLAVGDAGFQRKCLGKMGDIASSGRTVLFVSHDMGAVAKLCDRVMLLDQGQVQSISEPGPAIHQYLQLAADWRSDPGGVFNGPLAATLAFTELTLNDLPEDQPQIISPEDALTLRVTGHASEPIPAFRTTFSIYQDGVRVLTQHDTPEPKDLPAGEFRSSVTIPRLLLRPGNYTIAIGGYRDGMNEYLWGSDLARFTVTEQWSADYDPINLGLINVPGHGTRETQSKRSTSPSRAA
ncbi:MAG: ABC transporter ATP-binding protein [Phycisphaerales bacterium JB063]